jgi:hypothetical protein
MEADQFSKDLIISYRAFKKKTNKAPEMSAIMTVNKLTKRKEQLNSSFTTPTKAPFIANKQIQSYTAPTRFCVTHAIPKILNLIKRNTLHK